MAKKSDKPKSSKKATPKKRKSKKVLPKVKSFFKKTLTKIKKFCKKRANTKNIIIAIVLFLVALFALFFSMNIAISKKLEDGFSIRNISLTTKKATSVFPFSIKMDSVTIKISDKVVVSNDIILDGLLPFFDKKITVKNINGSANLSVLNDSTINFRAKPLLFVARIFFPQEIQLNIDSLTLVDKKDKVCIKDGKVMLDNIALDGFNELKMDITSKIKTVNIKRKNEDISIKNISQQGELFYDDLQKLKNDFKFDLLTYKTKENQIKLTNFNNNLEFDFDEETKKANLILKPIFGDVFVNNEKYFDGAYIKGIKITTKIDSLLNPLKKTETKIFIEEKPFIKLTQTKKTSTKKIKRESIQRDTSYLVDVKIFDKKFTVAQSFLNTLNLIEDLKISLLKINIPNDSFNIEIKKNVLKVKDFNISPKISGEIQLSNEIVIKELTPSVTAKEVVYYIDKMFILGLVSVKGKMEAKYLKLGITLDDFGFSTQFNFKHSLVPYVSSEANIKYGKKLFGVNSVMKHKEKKFTDIQGFIDNHKAGMTINLKSRF